MPPPVFLGIHKIGPETQHFKAFSSGCEEHRLQLSPTPVLKTRQRKSLPCFVPKTEHQARRGTVDSEDSLSEIQNRVSRKKYPHKSGPDKIRLPSGSLHPENTASLVHDFLILTPDITASPANSSDLTKPPSGNVEIGPLCTTPKTHPLLSTAAPHAKQKQNKHNNTNQNHP
jgi:hypothetical protein